MESLLMSFSHVDISVQVADNVIRQGACKIAR